jgi:hypothetical protein
MKQQLEIKIDALSDFAAKAFEWVWKHEDESYREGTFESVCYVISDFILGNTNVYISGVDVSNKLKLMTRRKRPTSIQIKNFILSKVS